MSNSRKKHLIARRIAEEVKDGDVVYLGRGLPRMVADYVIDKDVTIILQSARHIDLAVLEAQEVDEKGNLAFDIIPGIELDFVTGAKKVIIAVTQKADDGDSKIVRECSHSLTAIGQVDLIVTDLGVIEVTTNGLLLKEMAAGVGLEDILKNTDADLLISDELETRASI